MRAEIEARVKVFRRALEPAASEPVPYLWRDDLKAFPTGCCELAGQKLAQYLRDNDKNCSLMSSLCSGMTVLISRATLLSPSTGTTPT